MIVVITTWLPRLACSQPGISPQTPPNRAAARIASGMLRDARQPAQIDPDQPQPEPAQIGLPLAADVEQPGMEGQRHRQPGEDQVGGVVERVAHRLAIAEGAVDQGLDGLDRALADQDDDEAGDQERQRQVEQRQEAIVGPGGQLARGGHQAAPANRPDSSIDPRAGMRYVPASDSDRSPTSARRASSLAIYLANMHRDLQERARTKLIQLDRREAARAAGAVPGNRLERLSGDRQGQWSIRVSAQWRICFRWDDGHSPRCLVRRLSLTGAKDDHHARGVGGRAHRLLATSTPRGSPRMPPVHPGEILLEDFMKPLGLSAPGPGPRTPRAPQPAARRSPPASARSRPTRPCVSPATSAATPAGGCASRPGTTWRSPSATSSTGSPARCSRGRTSPTRPDITPLRLVSSVSTYAQSTQWHPLRGEPVQPTSPAAAPPPAHNCDGATVPLPMDRAMQPPPDWSRRLSLGHSVHQPFQPEQRPGDQGP